MGVHLRLLDIWYEDCGKALHGVTDDGLGNEGCLLSERFLAGKVLMDVDDALVAAATEIKVG